MPEALDEQWRDLFAAAEAFRDLGPWVWMDDNMVFGVVDANQGQIAWCSVLGLRGEVFGLAAYLGAAGLSIHCRIQAGELRADDDEIRYGFPCLMVSFENRQGLEASDFALIKSLGLTFRGRNSWPQFRSHRRGWYPWRLDGSEVVFFTEVLQQAFVACSRLRSEPELLAPPRAKELFVRVMAADGGWIDQWIKPAPSPVGPLQESVVDETEAARLKGSTARQEGIWEADLFYVPTPTRELPGERPYYPMAMCWVDQHSGLGLGIELLDQADDPDLKAWALNKQLLELVRKHSRIPLAIHVPRQALAAALRKVAAILGCELSVLKRLPALEELKENLFQHFAGGDVE